MNKFILTALFAITMLSLQPAPAHAGFFSDTWNSIKSWAVQTFSPSNTNQHNSAAAVVAKAKSDIDYRYREGIISFEEWQRLSVENGKLARKLGATIPVSNDVARKSAEDAQKAWRAGKITYSQYQAVLSNTRRIVNNNKETAAAQSGTWPGTSDIPGNYCGCR